MINIGLFVLYRISCFFPQKLININALLFLFFFSQKLVVKPDQLIKRRGKLGLIKVNTDFEGVKQWVGERMNKTIQVLLFCVVL